MKISSVKWRPFCAGVDELIKRGSRSSDVTMLSTSRWIGFYPHHTTPLRPHMGAWWNHLTSKEGIHFDGGNINWVYLLPCNMTHTLLCLYFNLEYHRVPYYDICMMSHDYVKIACVGATNIKKSYNDVYVIFKYKHLKNVICYSRNNMISILPYSCEAFLKQINNCLIAALTIYQLLRPCCQRVPRRAITYPLFFLMMNNSSIYNTLLFINVNNTLTLFILAKSCKGA